jgi:hypothetical protein
VLTTTRCIICGSKGATHCPKCKTLVCVSCHKPTTQMYCELCLGHLPDHKTDCENKMKLSYMKFSHIPITYLGVRHQIDSDKSNSR